MRFQAKMVTFQGCQTAVSNKNILPLSKQNQHEVFKNGSDQLSVMLGHKTEK